MEIGAIDVFMINSASNQLFEINYRVFACLGPEYQLIGCHEKEIWCNLKSSHEILAPKSIWISQNITPIANP